MIPSQAIHFVERKERIVQWHLVATNFECSWRIRLCTESTKSRENLVVVYSGRQKIYLQLAASFSITMNLGNGLGILAVNDIILVDSIMKLNAKITLSRGILGFFFFFSLQVDQTKRTYG